MIYKAVREVGSVIIFSTLIILCCFLPIFAFDGVAGKLFHPLAFTMGFSLIGAVIASLLFLPAIASIYIPNKNHEENSKLHLKHKEIMSKISDTYVKFLHKVFAYPKNSSQLFV